MDIENKNNRLGLSLSGGGFRASFYHIGVLAKMAELGILKHVEVISTVSGGSIVGAAYYLLLKDLLESKPDVSTKNENAIQDSDYIAIVEKLEKHFLSAVQKNLRMRTFYKTFKNIKMLLPNYSRSDVIGELYDSEIYAGLLDVGGRPIGMRDLLINPKGLEKGMFKPMHVSVGNKTRIHKVPVLVLNATSLNSGHNWCFTASWMGEMPPRNEFFRDMDKKDRYRRVFYDEIKTRKEKDFKLGKAVAASAGVPGLFPPLAVSDLYLDRRVQLVDGGVFDNQGITGLLDHDLSQHCTDFIVSDASGQSEATNNPQTGTINVVVNSSSISMGRVREELVNNTEKNHPEHIAYMHLTRGIFAKDIEFNQQSIKNQAGSKMKNDIVSSYEDFGVDEDMQRVMSKIRTDLDSFTDIEAGCLQADGYQMSESRLVGLPSIYQSSEKAKGNWKFSAFIKKISIKDELIHKHLEVSSNLFFKPFLHFFKGTLDTKQKINLILVSLPLVLFFLLFLFIIDFGLKQYFNINILGIILHKKEFQQFLTAIAPALYIIIVTAVCSTVLSKLVPGSGKWVTRIRVLIKSPVTLVVGSVVRVLLPALFAFPVWLYLQTIDKFYIKSIGKIR